MCKQLAVSRAGYYKWLHHEPSSVEEENEQIAVWIKEYNETYKSTLGYRRMHDYINRDKGKIYSKGRIHQIMQVHGIKSVIRKKKKTYLRSTAGTTAENILHRDFEATRPNEK